MNVATAAQEYAGYASPNKHAALQMCVVAINSMVDVEIRKVMNGEQLEDSADALVNMIEPLLNTTHGLIIRPVAYPSALITLTTAHKLVMLLEMVEVPTDFDFDKTRRKWDTAVKELSKGNVKWARLNALPGSLVRLVHTELDLTIMSIPDPKVRMEIAQRVTCLIPA